MSAADVSSDVERHARTVRGALWHGQGLGGHNNYRAAEDALAELVAAATYDPEARPLGGFKAPADVSSDVEKVERALTYWLRGDEPVPGDEAVLDMFARLAARAAGRENVTEAMDGWLLSAERARSRARTMPEEEARHELDRAAVYAACAHELRAALDEAGEDGKPASGPFGFPTGIEDGG